MTNADDARSTKEQNGYNTEEASLSASPPTPNGQVLELDAPARLARIRELNDQLRMTGRGGMVVMTNGVAALGMAKAKEIFAEVAAFTDFNPDNDPWCEHDCASLEVSGHRVIWKVDYYDRSRQFLSPDPADPKVTIRVLTIMLASEY